jgi:hypothetical protein
MDQVFRIAVDTGTFLQIFELIMRLDRCDDKLPAFTVYFEGDTGLQDLVEQLVYVLAQLGCRDTHGLYLLSDEEYT